MGQTISSRLCAAGLARKSAGRFSLGVRKRWGGPQSTCQCQCGATSGTSLLDFMTGPPWSTVMKVFLAMSSLLWLAAAKKKDSIMFGLMKT